MLPFDIRHIVVCHVQKKLFTIKNSPVFFGPPCKWLLCCYDTCLDIWSVLSLLRMGANLGYTLRMRTLFRG